MPPRRPCSPQQQLCSFTNGVSSSLASGHVFAQALILYVPREQRRAPVPDQHPQAALLGDIEIEYVVEYEADLFGPKVESGSNVLER